MGKKLEEPQQNQLLYRNLIDAELVAMCFTSDELVPSDVSSGVFSFTICVQTSIQADIL